ncbi:cell division protein FtsX [Geothermobacter ehrlichii]|uniref:Cell division protein FtsX n=1 Tax=Geothermobacter ehrlichii TaxID=213224 RepID=A0A5D3WK62_9BACT|nr:permease-like cell division protein FtsX [Geothermobacter ehrlichii]TYO98744.1 cell division protein FtsX [Geothermobacter ehrlichii]
MRRLIYLVVRALRNMSQSPFLCAAAVGTVTVSLLILAFFALVVLNVQQLTRHWSRDVQIVAYFERQPSGRQIDRALTRLRAWREVEGVGFVSSRQAYQRFSRRLGDDADLLAGMPDDFLPASIEIRLKEPFRNRAGVEQVVARLKAEGDFSDLRYGHDWLERFEAFLTLLRTAGLILGGFLLFAALFIVANTIKLTLYARREELEVMALVGGTPAFIKTPFLVEGALQGALGGLLALLASFTLFNLFLRQDLGALLLAAGISRIRFLPPDWQLLLVGIGTALGFLGSLFSLRRFVRI